MDSDTNIKQFKEFCKNLTVGRIVKAIIFNIGYLFTLTILGALLVSLYGYYIPINPTYAPSVLAVTIIFTSFVIIDFGLLISNKPTPTIIAILFVVGGVFMIYRLLKNTDFIEIDRNMPAKIKRYVPLRLLNC
jgi:hypothetical protein